MAKKNKLEFLWLIFVIMLSYVESSAKLPFKDKEELFNYVRNLNPESLQSAKPLTDYLDSVGVEPTDPVLLKGINLFNSGKIEDAIKYYEKIYRSIKYTPKQREYAGYQLFHIAYFGMLDPRYNGRPTKINRTNGFCYGSIYYNGESPSIAILAGLYPSIIYERIWNTYAFDCYSKWHLENWDLDILLSLLKATCYGRNLKDFPFVKKNGWNVNLNGFADLMQNDGSLGDYMTSNRELPKLEILRKGIDLDLAGKHDKALKYFQKLSYKYYGGYLGVNYTTYAQYQCWHIMNFGQTDPYYNGKPSNIQRSFKGNITQITSYPKKLQGHYGVRAPTIPYLTIKASLQPSFMVIDEYREKVSVYDRDYLNLLISTVFMSESSGDDITSYFTLGKELKKEDLRNFEKGVSLELLMSKMKNNEDNLLGIGMSKDQLFVEGTKLLPPLPDFKFDKGYQWDESEKIVGKANNYLLKSAIMGNSVAMNAFIVYNLARINTYKYDKTNEGINFARSKKLKDFVDALNDVSTLSQHKSIINQYEGMINEVYSYHKGIYEAMLAEQRRAEYERNERKRQERAQFWGGLAIAVLQGVSDGLNTYSQIASQQNINRQQAQARNRSAASSSNQNMGPLAQQMSQPGYFQQEFQRILQQSVAQVEQQEMAEYQQMRQNYLAMGKDLSLMEFRALKGQAIMVLKNQGIDIVAEQKAANKELHDFNHSQMNSGKENVERIKQQNAAKSGKTTSSTSSSSNYNKSAGKPVSTNNTSTNSSSQNGSTTNSLTTTITSNAGSGNYRYIQRKVNLHENPNSNSAVVFQNCEVYVRGLSYYVKIGEQYYKIQPCNKQHYNRTITYGSHPYYFNM